MTLASEYTNNNLHLIRQLVGQKIKSIIRLTWLDPEDELRLELGSLLLETYNNVRLYIDVDEGLGNIILFDASSKNQTINSKIKEFPEQIQLYPENKNNSILNSFLAATIEQIEIISRLDEIKTFFTICGFKLTFSHQKSLYLGSYLTELKTPEICLHFSEEVEKTLSYQILTSISE